MDILNGPYGAISQKTQAFCYVFITSQFLTLHFHGAGVWLLVLLYLAMVWVIFGLKKVLGECQKKWQNKGPPKIFPFIRAMKKRQNFLEFIL